MFYSLHFLLVLLTFITFSGCGRNIKYTPVKWKVGQWAAYEVNGEPLKVSIVGEDSSTSLKNKTSFWLETAEPEIIVKLLVEEGKINEPLRIIAKRLGEPAVEFGTNKIGIKSGLPLMELFESEKGERKILTLPVGKFKTVYFKKEDKEIWLSNTVPVLGIVKYASSDKNIVLCGLGTKGAKSEINGVVEVVEFF